MIRITTLLISLILVGCGDLLPKQDTQLEAKISRVLRNSEVQAMKVMDLTIMVTILGKEVFELDNTERDKVALEIGYIALKSSKTVETIVVTFMRGGNGSLTAFYTWENKDGKLKPLEQEFK